MRQPFTRANRGAYGHWLQIWSGRARGGAAAAMPNATTKTDARARTELAHAPTRAVPEATCTAINRENPVADARVFSSVTPLPTVRASKCRCYDSCSFPPACADCAWRSMQTTTASPPLAKNPTNQTSSRKMRSCYRLPLIGVMSREGRHAPVHFHRRCLISVRVGALAGRFAHCYRAAASGMGIVLGESRREGTAMTGRPERKGRFSLAGVVIQNTRVLQSSVYRPVVK